jgi:hypothetical protein
MYWFFIQISNLARLMLGVLQMRHNDTNDLPVPLGNRFVVASGPATPTAVNFSAIFGRTT